MYIVSLVNIIVYTFITELFVVYIGLPHLERQFSDESLIKIETRVRKC